MSLFDGAKLQTFFISARGRRYIIGEKTLFFDIHQNRSSADIFPHSMRANINIKE